MNLCNVMSPGAGKPQWTECSPSSYQELSSCAAGTTHVGSEPSTPVGELAALGRHIQSAALAKARCQPNLNPRAASGARKGQPCPSPQKPHAQSSWASDPLLHRKGKKDAPQGGGAVPLVIRGSCHLVPSPLPPSAQHPAFPPSKGHLSPRGRD